MAVVRVFRCKLVIEPKFHQTDMMGMVHNSEYLRWFEEGRLQILLNLLPFEETMALGVIFPVVRNECSYRRPIRFGDTAILRTTHALVDPYPGNMEFDHVLTNTKTKEELAVGKTVVTIMNVRDNTLVREWPADIRRHFLEYGASET